VLSDGGRVEFFGPAIVPSGEKTVQSKTALVAAAILVSGCFQYRNAPINASVPAGQAVRLELTDAGRVNVAARAGEGVDEIDGVVDMFSPDTVVLRVTSVRRRDVPETWTKERLAVAASDVRAMSVRRFDPLRTGILVGGVFLVGSTVRLGGSSGLFGGRSRPGGPNSGR
jgi:hypothetical protein